MHPFRWIPADGQRHVTKNLSALPTGTQVTTLCDQALLADNSTLAWFWLTCTRCNEKAHDLAGLPMPHSH